jgi:hypothetical protein
VKPHVWDPIELEDHIGPALHEMMGTSDDAMEKGLLEWIDQRLEEIADEEERARENLWVFVIVTNVRLQLASPLVIALLLLDLMMQ